MWSLHTKQTAGPLPIIDLAERLEELKCSSPHHAFWLGDFSLSEWVEKRGRHFSSNSLTDVYLLKLSARQQGALATFDSRIKASMIGESEEVVEYVPA